MENQKWRNLCERILCPILLALYPLRNIMIGVDLSDTTYSLGNYLFLEDKSGTNLFSTYLANVCGNFFMKLPMGNTMLGMNFYTALLVSIIAISAYLFFRRKMPFFLVFIGEILAISLCWCPTAILYNYITYFFLTMAVICLYIALVKEKIGLLFLSGVLLALNVFVRFPNILETGLILSVWYYAYLHKKKFKVVMKETGMCIAGFISGIACMILVISAKHGLSAYTDMLTELFILGSSGEGGYSPFEMIASVFRAYRDAGKWLLYLAAYTALGVYLFRIKKTACIKIKAAIFAVGAILLVFFLYKRGMFNFNYRMDYLSMFQWAAIFLLFAILLAFWTVFNKTKKAEDKLLALISLLIIAIIPLGSNNHIYPNINYLFLIAPPVLTAIWTFITSKEWEKTFYQKLPVKIMLGFVIIITMIQSMLFGYNFVFRGGLPKEKWDSKIEANPVLNGMYTSKIEKEAIEELTEFAEKEKLKDKTAVMYGFIPGVPYILSLPCAISTSYPDMDSYAKESFFEELTESLRISEVEEKEKPIIVLGNQAITDVQGNAAEKLEFLYQIIDRHKYKQTFTNVLFTVYQ